ncbi:MAG TPA: reverse transcriptase family protein [Ktedonobacterales bacterium]|jgi:retron-type reverse transcriptase
MWERIRLEAMERWRSAREARRQARQQRKQNRRANDRVTFGEETWGISAQHRRATLNAAKLQRFDLPILRTEQELADWLGIPLTRLRWFTHDRPADTTWHYVRYVIPKRSGGQRVILAPKRELKALQRRVLDGIVARVPMAPSAHGFVRGRSILSNARPHVGQQVVLTLDLQDFFPSITFPRVRGLFLSLGYPFSVAATLALLCTEYDREPFERDNTRYFISIGPRYLVQGAPTSPGLANLVAWRLDRRLNGLAQKQGFTYTRYADDLTFSGNSPDVAPRIRLAAERIITDEHFQVNQAKTRIARPATRQIVTGLVVNEALAVPRQVRRRLRAILHHAQHEGLAAQNREGHRNYRAYLLGMIAFVHAANPSQAAALRASLHQQQENA